MYGVLAHIAGLDADKIPPLAVSEVAHAARLLCPRIPYDRGERILFSQGKPSLQDRVDQFDGVLRIQKYAVGLSGKLQRAMMVLALAVVGLVNEVGRVESINDH